LWWLDGGGLLGLGATRLDDVGVDGALRQERRAFDGATHVPALVTTIPRLELGGLGLEHLDEQAPDDLALGFGVAHAGQFAQEQLAGIHAHHLGVQLSRKHVHHHVAFVQAQEAMIDEDAGELVANGTVDQCRRHAGINPA
jgi:hypothetical protein